MTATQAAIPETREHIELLSAFRIISVEHSWLDSENMFPYSPEPVRRRSSAGEGEREEFDWDEDGRLHMLYYYNWYFHTCRVELSVTRGVVDGRPELHRQDFRRLLADYFDDTVPWPLFVDRYYFDLERHMMRTAATVSRHLAVLSGPLPVQEGGLLDHHDHPYHGLSNALDVARASIVGFEQLGSYAYTSWMRDGHLTEEYLMLSGLAPYVSDWGDRGMKLFVPGVDIDLLTIVAKHGSVSKYLVKQWCAVYKCCQVRVDGSFGRETLLEDGRTPALRSRLDTNYMMGFFSKELIYHPPGEARDKDGYTPLPLELHRVQILQHRRWLLSRLAATRSCVLYDSDEDSLFPDRDYPEREGVSRLHGKWPPVTEFAPP